MKKMLNKMRNIIIASLILFSCEHNSYLIPQVNFEAAKSEATKKNTKIFIIFDVFGSSTKYVDNILKEEKIIKALSKFVVVRLMCDEKRMLNDSIFIGQFNSDLQIKLTGQFYQPMFCFLDKQGNRIALPCGYSNKSELLEYIQKN